MDEATAGAAAAAAASVAALATVVDDTRDIHVHPRNLCRDLAERVEEQLRAEIEGTFSTERGFLLAVIWVNPDDLEAGVFEGGYERYRLRFRVRAYLPVRGHKIRAVCCHISEQGAMFVAGPVRVFVSRHMMGEPVCYDEDGGRFLRADLRLAVQLDSLRWLQIEAVSPLTGDRVAADGSNLPMIATMLGTTRVSAGADAAAITDTGAGASAG